MAQIQLNQADESLAATGSFRQKVHVRSPENPTIGSR